MNQNVTINQVFEWSFCLSKQSNFSLLTTEILRIIQSLDGVSRSLAYEVYAGRAVSSSTNNQNERVIRRFPLDFTGKEQEGEYDELLEQYVLTESEGIQTFSYESKKIILLHVKTDSGPDRAILIESSDLPDTLLYLLENLVGVYKHLLNLHDSKERDQLTRLPNRQSFERRLFDVCEYFHEHEIKDTLSDKGSWLAMLDIDFFKRVNDNFGHLYGDEVLLHFSQLMENEFRYNDFLFRFGGEEFVVILNLLDMKDAQAVFERFRIVIENFKFPAVGQVTVSMGIVHINRDSLPATLLDQADKALYFAKETGRNKVIFYEDMDTEEELNEGGGAELF